MILAIVRHGKAEQDSPTGLDQDRALRPRGSRQADFLAACFADRDVSPRLILASRYKRAIDTATVIRAAVDRPLKLETSLEIGHGIEAALDLIRAHKPESPLMLVGHNNQLEDLVNHLLGPDADFGPLRTGEAAVVEIGDEELANPAGRGRLVDRLRYDGE